VAQHFVVVGEVVRQAQRNRIETGRLWRQIEPRGVRSAHNACEMLQTLVGQPVFFKKGIEAAFLPGMAQLDAGNVVGRCASLAGDGENAIGRHKEKFGVRIDEAADEPRTGYPVNFWPFARDPARRRVV
jgi:hypothetical protein